MQIENCLGPKLLVDTPAGHVKALQMDVAGQGSEVLIC